MTKKSLLSLSVQEYRALTSDWSLNSVAFCVFIKTNFMDEVAGQKQCNISPRSVLFWIKSNPCLYICYVVNANLKAYRNTLACVHVWVQRSYTECTPSVLGGGGLQHMWMTDLWFSLPPNFPLTSEGCSFGRSEKLAANGLFTKHAHYNPIN